jgi:hypothetical protein
VVFSASIFGNFMNTNAQHPGKAFGAWLKAKRQAKGIIARIFAGQIWLSHSKYAEAELGVTKWIGQKQQAIIPILLELAEGEVKKFNQLLEAAKRATALTFDKIFKRDDLKPVRAAHSQGKQISLEEENALLDIVFQPLPA